MSKMNNWKKFQEENPEVARFLKMVAYQKHFNEDYEEIAEEEEIDMKGRIHLFADRNIVFERIGFI